MLRNRYHEVLYGSYRQSEDFIKASDFQFSLIYIKGYAYQCNKNEFVSRDLYWPICEKMVLETVSICTFKFSIVQIEEEKAVVSR